MIFLSSGQMPTLRDFKVVGCACAPSSISRCARFDRHEPADINQHARLILPLLRKRPSVMVFTVTSSASARREAALSVCLPVERPLLRRGSSRRFDAFGSGISRRRIGAFCRKELRNSCVRHRGLRCPGCRSFRQHDRSRRERLRLATVRQRRRLSLNKCFWHDFFCQFIVDFLASAASRCHSDRLTAMSGMSARRKPCRRRWRSRRPCALRQTRIFQLFIGSLPVGRLEDISGSRGCALRAAVYNYCQKNEMYVFSGRSMVAKYFFVDYITLKGGFCMDKIH